jgi:hypothetical protein
MIIVARRVKLPAKTSPLQYVKLSFEYLLCEIEYLQVRYLEHVNLLFIFINLDVFLQKLLDLGAVYHLKKFFLKTPRLLLILAMPPLALDFHLELPLLLSVLFEPGKQWGNECLCYLLKPSFDTSEILFKVFGAIIHVFVLLNPIIVLSQSEVGLPIHLNVSVDAVQNLLHLLRIQRHKAVIIRLELRFPWRSLVGVCPFGRKLHFIIIYNS